MARAAITCLPGDIFGTWVVVGDVEPGADGKRRILVRCECGSQATFRSAELNAGRTASCACQGPAPRKRAEAPKPKPKPVTPTRNPGQVHASRDAQVVEVLIEDGIRVVVVDCPYRCGVEHRHCLPFDALPDCEPVRWSKCRGTGKGGLYRLVGWEDIEPTIV